MADRRDVNLAATHELLRRGARDLDYFFTPKAVAVIGATETPGSVGRTVLWNLISSPFGGTVFPVNPKRASVLGIKAYPDIAAVPGKVELAVIVTPAPTVPGLLTECEHAGVRAAIIISAGFRESGVEGAILEQQLRDAWRSTQMRIIGPNCLGVMSPRTGLNATFAAAMARPGNVGFISQSGALLTSILDWSLQENIGFSAFVSVGSMMDVGWGDLIDYLGDDPATQSIMIYMESIGDAKHFLSAARAVALQKPIIVIKAGQTEAAAKAAASHTGALTGSDEVLEAAFRRVGVLRVNTIAELFNMAEVLAAQPRPEGPRLAIVTNAGGPGVLATDALINGGGELATLSAETIQTLNAVMPPHWSHGNPIDVLGDAGPDRYATAVDAVMDDASSDGVLVLLTPQAMTNATLTAEQLKPYAHRPNKPLLASWMGGGGVAAGRAILRQARIPSFNNPESAVRAFLYMWRYSYNIRGLYETPALVLPEDLSASSEAAGRILNQVRASGRELLSEVESKQLLSAYDIPTVETRIATSSDEAVEAADQIGYPVVLKLYSPTITHKTDVGGVQLNLANADRVRQAWQQIEKSVAEKAGPEHFAGVTVQPMVSLAGYELIIGSSIDPQFGPVLLFGAGGQLVEVFRDRALALPPLNTTLALRLMQQTRIFKALEGVRGRKPVDLRALEHVLVRFSQLVVEQRRIKEIDINPLLASDSGLIALDARVILHPADTPDEQLPRPAIRPYPVQYIERMTLPDGTQLKIRPIRPEDEPLLVKFHQTLSDDTVYRRYSQTLHVSQRVAHERLSRICFNDYEREIALIAELRTDTGERQVIAVVRLIRLPGTDAAELALIVSDAYQGRGLGIRLTERAVNVARQEQIQQIIAYMLPVNRGMQRICERLGFQLVYESSSVVGYLDLSQAAG
jgi:acetyltransferase